MLEYVSINPIEYRLSRFLRRLQHPLARITSALEIITFLLKDEIRETFPPKFLLEIQ